jgi:phosphopantetheine--protein transferase-like protein
MIIFGNDIVDIHYPGIRDTFANLRFQKKVFSNQELDYLYSLSSEETILQGFCYWSLKEAAYKAFSRKNPGLVFNHKKFEVFNAGNNISYEGNYILAKSYITENYVYSMCVSQDNFSAVQHCVNHKLEVIQFCDSPLNRISLNDLSALVREQAKGLIRKYLGLTPDIEIQIEKKRDENHRTVPPVANVIEKQVLIPLSLTHHHNYVASMFLKEALM